MKQIRKISNLVAEELQNTLNESGATMSEVDFESAVSQVIEGLEQSIEEAIDEDIFVDEIYLVNTDSTVGGVDLVEGDFVEIDEIDMDTETVTVTIYDSEGEIKSEAVELGYSDFDVFCSSDAVEPVELGDEEGEDEELMEAKKVVRGGKIVTLKAAVVKIKNKLKKKNAGSGPNKFTVKAGKIVRKTSDEIRNAKKKGIAFGKKMKHFAKKRLKSFNKGKKFHQKASEGFDVVANGMKIAVEEGDVLTVEEGLMSVVRDGKTLVEGVHVDDSFLTKCIEEGVLSDIATMIDEEETAEVAEVTEVEEVAETVAEMLTYKPSKGYVLVKEGSEVPMGNRVRTRAFLKTQGVEVSADMLDRASTGEMVIL